MIKILKKILHKSEDYIFNIIIKIFKYIKKSRKKGFLHFIKSVIMLILSTFFLFAGLFLIWFATLNIPTLEVFDDKILGQSAKIYDRSGTVLLYDLSQKVRRTVVPLDDISSNIKNATISIEDEDFYTHKGIRLSSIFRALLANLAQGEYAQGGSTITQQVVKNSLLTREKTISRKIKEIFLSIKLERDLTKDQILTLYLNNTPYGGNIYGVEEASQVFFGKKAKDLSVSEAAVIASLPKAPSRYNPYTGNKQILLERKNLVLLKMHENGYITSDELTKYKTEDIIFEPKNLNSIKAAHFVMYLKNILEKEYGQKRLAEDGLKIISTLDYEIQRKGEEIVYDYINKNQKRFGAENGSFVVIDPKNGQIRAMIGSRNYFDQDIDGNFNIATAKRQPGSSFKPFVYAAGFNLGFTPQTVLFDTATEFNPSCNPDGTAKVQNANCYSPKNYEGGFKGPINIRQALASSRNIPAVKMAYLTGVQNVINLAKNMGVNDLKDQSYYGLSLALGSADVSLLDMVSAYSVFANDGVKNNISSILKIEDPKGNIIYEFSTSSKNILENESARMINDILSDPNARSSIFPRGYFKERIVAMKTGTTNNSHDAWTIGYTPNIVLGAWIGNNNNKAMNPFASATIVAPMWKLFMDELLKITDKEDFIKPDEISTDKKAFMRGIYTNSNGEIHSELYFIDKNNPEGPIPNNPSKDPLFDNFEASVYMENVSTSTNNSTSTQTFNTNNFKIKILGENQGLSSEDSVNIIAENINNTIRIEYFLNDNKLGENSNSPYNFFINLNNIDNLKSKNEIRAIEYKNDGSTPSVSTTNFSFSD